MLGKLPTAFAHAGELVDTKPALAQQLAQQVFAGIEASW